MTIIYIIVGLAVVAGPIAYVFWGQGREVVDPDEPRWYGRFGLNSRDR